MIRALNTRVNEKQPWKLAKSDPARCELVIFDLVWSLRLVARWIEPFMPNKSAEMQMQLGVRVFSEALPAAAAVRGKIL